MIPIKRIKKQVVAEFEEAAVLMEIKIQSMRIANRLKGHYVKIPWGLENGAIMTARWNIKRERFDKITFNAFGRLHTIKL